MTTEPQIPTGYRKLDPSKDGPKLWDDLYYDDGWRLVGTISCQVDGLFNPAFTYIRRLESPPTPFPKPIGDLEGLPLSPHSRVLVFHSNSGSWERASVREIREGLPEYYTYWMNQPPPPPVKSQADQDADEYLKWQKTLSGDEARNTFIAYCAGLAHARSENKKEKV